MMATILWLAVTIGVFVAAERLYAWLRSPLAHPVVVTTLAIIAGLLLTHTPYEHYADATVILTYALVPATAALAVPLFRHLHGMRRRAASMAAVIAVSSISTVVLAVVLSRAFGCTSAVVASLGAKSVTTPVAIAISAQIGGIPALSAVFAILSGVIGALLAPAILRRCDAWIAGTAIGSVAHGVGTAQLARSNAEATAYSGVAMGANAIASAVILPLFARFFVIAGAVFVSCTALARADAPRIVFVPLDDRPVTLQLPLLLGRIAGADVIAPPRAMLGTYLHPGRPDDIIAWLNSPQARAQDYVVSSDMLAYGGLVASRVPGVSYPDALARLREIDHLHQRTGSPAVDVFGTIMRLAPTGVPALGQWSSYFAAYPAWTYVQEYARLHDPPLPNEQARAAQLRAALGNVLDEYMATRGRNLAVDRLLIGKRRDGSIERLILGQDDAGPFGLHVRDVSLLESDASGVAGVSIEPGADELGMAMLSARLARIVAWTPTVDIHYSTPEGAAYQDPLEFAPVRVPIERLVAACGGRVVERGGDIALFVRVPGTTTEEDTAAIAAMRAARAKGTSVAVADISFLNNSYDSLAHFADLMLDDGIAGDIDAYASWNTNANTVGTALAEAIAAGAGRRSGRYDALAHRTFTFMRFLDDVAFHARVRPALNASLDRQGISDHTLLTAPVAMQSEDINRTMLWGEAQRLLARLYPQLHIAALRITLPWKRTFETQIDAGLAPNLREDAHRDRP